METIKVSVDVRHGACLPASARTSSCCACDCRRKRTPISVGAEPKALGEWRSSDAELLAWAHRTPAQREADEQNRLANLYVGNPVTDLYMHADDPIEDTAGAIEAEETVERLNLEIWRARKDSVDASA